jgi:hypothetical protein
MRIDRVVTMLTTLGSIAVVLVACQSSRRPPKTGLGEVGGVSSLYVRATFNKRERLLGYNARVFCYPHLHRLRAAVTGEDGSAVIDSIPAGTWGVHSGMVPNPWQWDTLNFVAGRQETLWIDVFAWAPQGEDLMFDKKTRQLVDTSRPDTASKYQRRLRR